MQGLELFQINGAAAAQKFGSLVKKFWFFRAHSSLFITGSSSVGQLRVRRSETWRPWEGCVGCESFRVSRAVRNRARGGWTRPWTQLLVVACCGFEITSAFGNGGQAGKAVALDNGSGEAWRLLPL